MKIVGLNFDIYWKDKKTNFRQIEDYLEMIEADIFVLPERDVFHRFLYGS